MRNTIRGWNETLVNYNGIDLVGKSAYPQPPERIRPLESQNRVRCALGTPKLSVQNRRKPGVFRAPDRPGEHVMKWRLEQQSEPGSNMLLWMPPRFARNF